MRKDLEGPIIKKLDAARKKVVRRIIDQTERAIAQDPDGPLALEAEGVAEGSPVITVAAEAPTRYDYAYESMSERPGINLSAW